MVLQRTSGTGRCSMPPAMRISSEVERGEAQRADEERRMVADDDGDRAGQAALLVLLPDDVAVGGLRQLHAEQVLLVHHVAVDADIVDAGLRIAHHREALR